MKKQNHTSQKGITLIALIITIIVMLILVAVSVTAAINGGLFTKAKGAGSQTLIEQEKEQLLGVLGAIGKSGKIDFSEVENYLPENFEEIPGEATATTRTYVSKNGNKYIVNENMEITYIEAGKVPQEPQTPEANTPEDLLDYILGEKDAITGQRLGKGIWEIVGLDDEGMIFINIPEGLKDGELTVCIGNEVSKEVAEKIDTDGTTIYEIRNNYDFYFTYEDIMYKFRVNFDEEWTEGTTLAEVGVKNLSYDITSRVGKCVNYDGLNWIVLYDDDINGLQMISEEVQPYNDDWFYLGAGDSLITNWDSLIDKADLDNSESLDNVEKSVYSYNNAIETLNSACEKIVTPYEGKILDVRSVGSNPINKNSENTKYYKNGIGKDEDENYMADYDRMTVLGIGESNSNYWLASRWIDLTSDRTYFKMRYSDSLSFFADDNNYVWRIYNGENQGNTCYRGLRPVVILNTNIQFEGEGTESSPFVIE